MKIALLGDIALFGINTINTNNWKERFAEVKRIIDSCDYVVGNLETPLTNYKKKISGKSAYIKGTPRDVKILKYLGVTHVSLANNHIFDYQAKGLVDTIDCLNRNNIKWFGINDICSDLTFGNENVRLLGYCCYSTNAVGLERNNNYVNLLNPLDMEKDIKKAAEAGFLPIVSCHWGQEHVHYPNYDHMVIARNLAKKNKIIVYGHHPHVIQGIEEIANSLILYSLGNFCFDDVYTSKSKDPLVKLSLDNQESFICILSIEGGNLRKKEIIPFSFSNGKYTLDVSINFKIKEWTDFLQSPTEKYISKRKEDIDAYIAGRKSKRTLSWYLKRLNYNSAIMILRSKINNRRYKTIIESFYRSIN